MNQKRLESTWAIPSAAVLGQQLRAARLKKGLSQRELAKQFYCSLRWIHEIEQGKDSAQVGKVLSLCQFLELELQLTVVNQEEQPEQHLNPSANDRACENYPDLETILQGQPWF